MNELMQHKHRAKDSLLLLRVTVSMLAIFHACPAAASEIADDPDKPTIWIDLGGQLEQANATQARFQPEFLTVNAESPAFDLSPIRTQRSPRFSYGGEGRVSFEPKGTGWIFSVAVRYGRSNGTKHLHQQTAGLQFPASDTLIGRTPSQVVDGKVFSDAKSKQSESHTVLDFQVGKDVGLGILGRHSEFFLEAGIRYAQFSSKMSSSILARPQISFKPPIGVKYWNDYSFIGSAERNFHGLGPSIALSGSTSAWGVPNEGGISVDWGANAALLFGRQRANINHETHASRYSFKYDHPTDNPGMNRYRSLYHHLATHNRERGVMVPNVGGFAALSLKYSNAKVSLGYRADFFFGAIDGGTDSRKSFTPGTYGPFATISIGLGG